MSAASGTAPRLTALLVAGVLAACESERDRAAVATPGDPKRGEAVFALAGGCGCHTPEEGPIGAGGVELETPFGTFYSSNITPDREHGIGAWSDAEIARAIRAGELDDGSVEAPVMPYFAYAGMADDDLRDLIAYLRTLPPAARRNRPHEVDLPLPRLAFRAWRLLFAGGADAPERAPADGVARGRYLVDHVGICGDCHTPRDRFGAPEGDMYLAGTRSGPDGELVPNLTSDRETGVGTWDESDLVSLLQLGMKPDFDNVQGSMAELIDGIAGAPGLGKAPEDDLKTIAAYLKTVPPIHHVVAEEKEKAEEAKEE
ncbi:MAG: cytochrome c [Thermodesulfobacteriota bacterium]